jgi:hypothetical protein
MLLSLLSNSKTASYFKTIGAGVVFIGLLLGLVTLQRQRLATLQTDTTTSASFEQQDRATASALSLAQKMPTFGFNNLVANWTFLQFLQYFGDSEVRAQAGYDLSPEFFRVIIPKDPFYRYFYLFLSGSSSNYAGQPEHTIEIINQGLERLTPTLPPDSFYIWRYRGVDELLYLGDGKAAQKSFQTAAEWARQSPHPDAPFMADNSQRTADFLANNPLSKQAQVNAWASVLANAFDDATRQKAIDRIEALGGQVTISETGGISLQFPEDD